MSKRRWASGTTDSRDSPTSGTASSIRLDHVGHQRAMPVVPSACTVYSLLARLSGFSSHDAQLKGD